MSEHSQEVKDLISASSNALRIIGNRLHLESMMEDVKGTPEAEAFLSMCDALEALGVDLDGI